jgi:peptide/nickel transport system substrate-binding protein
MRKTLVILFLVAMLAMPATAFAQEEDETSIILADLSDVSTWNPVLSGDNASSAAFGWIYLFTLPLDPFTGARTAGVFDTWEISDDNMTYTFHVREDIFWSDGEQLDASDVFYTYNATMSDVVETPRKGDFASVTNVELVDDFHIAFTFESPSCNALDSAGMYVIPEHKFAADFSDIMNSALNTFPDVSVGPYILDEWVPDDYMSYTANPDYSGVSFGEPPVHIDRLFRRIIPDESTTTQALKTGEVDYDALSSLQWDELIDEPNLNLYESPGGSNQVNFIAFNTADPAAGLIPGLDEDGNPLEQPPHPIFGDKRVRQALSYGWDKQAVVDTVISGHGVPIYGTIAPSVEWAYNANLEPRAFDPDMADQLLEEAGWIDEDGDGVRECHGCLYAEEGAPMTFTLNTNAGNEVREQVCLLAQDYWRQLGVDVVFEPIEFGTMVTEYIYQQNFDAIMIGFGGGDPDPDGIAKLLMGVENDVENGFNMVSFYSPEYEELLDEGLYMPGCDFADRGAVYAKVQEIQWEEVVYEFIYNPYPLRAVNKRVQGFDPTLVWDPTANFAEWEIVEDY